MSNGFEKMMRTVGPFVAMAAMGGMMAARKRGENWGHSWPNWNGDTFANAFEGKFGTGPGPGGKFRFNGREGVKLEALDMHADAPRALILASGDQVVVEQGDDFGITLQGSDAAKAAVRFAIEDGALFVMRSRSPDDGDDFPDDEPGRATITVTLPALDKVTVAGSGDVTVAALAAEAELVIAGSGRVEASDLDLERLDVSIAGSGAVRASGTAARLDLSVAGSGSARLDNLLVDKARVSIAGSGNAAFSSDGAVKARLMGSGNVTVRGGARCKVQGMGSGTLVCERRDDGAKPEDEAA